MNTGPYSVNNSNNDAAADDKDADNDDATDDVYILSVHVSNGINSCAALVHAHTVIKTTCT